MKSHRTVNEVLDQLVALDGQPVQLEGILESHEEGYALKHYPKAERHSEYVEEGTSYQSGVWVEFGNGSLQPNDTVLGGWQGKRFESMESSTAWPPHHQSEQLVKEALARGGSGLPRSSHPLSKESPLRSGANMAPNPSIERTRSGKPGRASHVKR